MYLKFTRYAYAPTVTALIAGYTINPENFKIRVNGPFVMKQQCKTCPAKFTTVYFDLLTYLSLEGKQTTKPRYLNQIDRDTITLLDSVIY